MDEPLTDAGKGKVALVNLNPGEVRVEFLQALLDTIVTDLNGRRVINNIRATPAGPLLDIYRNRAVEWFLNSTTDEWMLFIDSDIVWKPEDIYTLLDAADPTTRPVVAGVYMMVLPEGARPGIFHSVNVDGVSKLEVWPDDVALSGDLIQVDGTGAGFLLMHRSLLSAMLSVYNAPMPWFANEVIDGVVHGEDFTFCARVQQMGFPVMVHTGVQLEHIKHATLRVQDFTPNTTPTPTPLVSPTEGAKQ